MIPDVLQHDPTTLSRRAVLLAGVALPLAVATRGFAEVHGLLVRDGWVLRADDLPRLRLR